MDWSVVPGGMLLVRQNHRGRNRHAQLARQRVVEELVVGGPPEGVVDDDRSRQHGVLQIGAVERNVLRDAVDDDAIPAGIGHLDAAHLDELRGHALDLHAVDLFHQRRRKGIFHPENDSDFLHDPPCHPERSRCFAKRSRRAAFGSAAVPAAVRWARGRRYKFTQDDNPKRNTLPPSAATAASRAWSCLPTHPASAELPWHAKSPTS